MKRHALGIGLACLLVAASLALPAQDRPEEQQRVVDAIQRLQGKVEIDVKSPGQPVLVVDL
jgi:hypothetical protein